MVSRHNKILKKELRIMPYPKRQRILDLRKKRNGKQSELSDFKFKSKDGKPFCFGRFGEFHMKKACSDCKFKKECYDKYEEEN